MKDLVLQIARFGTVGAGATVVHLGTAWAALHIAGVPPYGANTFGFLVAFLLSYLGHFFWTFGRRDGHRRHLPRFLIVAAAGYALSNLVVWTVTDLAARSFDLALLAILFTVPPATWALSRIWAFRAP